ncbi:hypothetical protein HYV87_02520 [Candidatus Woesearchaeota archaeon]|nr:hypothetical protein [Candidatus Woesearchaeota archaeon]
MIEYKISKDMQRIKIGNISLRDPQAAVVQAREKAEERKFMLGLCAYIAVSYITKQR